MVIEEVNKLSEQLQKKGYLESSVTANKRVNDSTSLFTMSLKKQTKMIHIYIGEKWKPILDTSNDTLKIAFSESESFLTALSKKMEQKGYAISKVQLRSIEKKNYFLVANLDINLEKKRIVNDIVIKGYDKFPYGYKKNILRKYKNATFNRESLEKINSDFNSIRFIKQLKYPEILFSTDSTKVYVFVEKKKNNFFDGFLGFSNSESKIIFNGYVDVSLNNILNTGDVFAVKWRSDGQEQTNFNLGIELPFVFKSPIGLKLQLNIFKQDSTFQNSKTSIDLAYHLTNKSKLYVGYISSESSDIGNLNSALLNDFTNRFYTSSFEHIHLQDDPLFTEKTNLFATVGTGKRDAKTVSNSQFFTQINLSHIFNLNAKNSIYLSSQNYFLLSNNYLTNELFRFGGIKSIRGFRENSLQANQVNLLVSEYRYKFSPSFYLHSIIDYGYYKDNTTDTSNRPLGFGLGLGLMTKGGLLNLVYANGIDNKQVVKFSNSIIHISLRSFF